MKTDKMLDSCDHSSSTSSGMGSEDSATMATSHGQQNGRSHAGHRPNPFQKRPFLIGVAGGTSSGKSTVCSKIMEKLGIVDSASPYLTHEKRVICISQDSFYRKLTEAEQAAAKVGNFNFDHPTAFDSKRLTRTIRDILKGKMVKVPVYNYKDNQIGDEEEVVYPADVVLVEGLLLFYFPEVRELFHMKVFVDTDMDTRLSRRVIRDVNYRQRDLNWVLDQYMKFVKPSFEEFCLPTKKYADIIVPRGPDNEVAVGLIVNQVESIFDPSIRHKSIKLDSDEEEEDVSSYYDEYSSYGSMGYANGYTGNGMSRTISRLENVHNYRRLNEFAAIIPEDVSNCVINGKCLTPTVLNGAQFTAAYKSAKAQQRQRSGASLCSEPQVRQSDRSETPELLFGDDDELDVELECDGDDTEDDEGEDSLGSSNRSNPIKIVRNLRAAGAPQKLAVAAVNNLWSSSAPSDLHSTLTATVNSTPILINGFSEAVDIQYSSSNDSSDDAEIAEDALSQEEELERAPNASASGAAITNKINLLKIH